MNSGRLAPCLVMTAFLSLCGEPATADVVAVVATDNPIDSLSQNELVNIFLGKSRRFPDDSPAVPVDQAENSPVRDEFYRKYAGKSPAQVKAHWSKLIFTGRGRPPKSLADGEEVKQWVAKNRDAIGYIERRLADESVKILQVE